MGFYFACENSMVARQTIETRGNFPWELDHMFVTEGLFNCLTNVEVSNQRMLSDHDPIIADFDLTGLMERSG